MGMTGPILNAKLFDLTDQLQHSGSMNVVAGVAVYVWIDYAVSDAYEWGGQDDLFRGLLEPLGLTCCGLGAGWRDIDFGVPSGADLRTIRNTLDVDLGFAFSAKLQQFPVDDTDEGTDV
jgi:hypothetical protein